MGQISPLDQLISSSAFNDCSVTVIYSGVIITDVLLLCDRLSAPAPSLFRADVVVFFGTTPPLLWCFAFLLFPVLLNARLPQWPDSGTRVTVSPDQQDCQASHERRSYAPSGPITAQPVRTNHPPSHSFVFESAICPLWPDVYTCVNASMCVFSFVCTDFLSSCVLVQTADS